MGFSREFGIGVFLLITAVVGIVLPPIYMHSKHVVSALRTFELLSKATSLLKGGFKGVEVVHSRNYSITSPIKVIIRVDGGALLINDSLSSELMSVKVLKVRGVPVLSTSEPKYLIRFSGEVLKAEVWSGVLVISVPKGKLSSLYVDVNGGAAKVVTNQLRLKDLRIKVSGGAAELRINELSNASVSTYVSGGALSTKLYLSRLGNSLVKVLTDVSGGLANVEIHCPTYKVKFVGSASGGLAEFSIDGRKVHVFGIKGGTYIDEGYEGAARKVSIVTEVSGGLATVQVMRGEGD